MTDTAEYDAANPTNFKINPSFGRRPAEAHLVGLILSAFGEIEFSVCRNAGNAFRAQRIVLKALYRLRMTSARFDAADAFARPIFKRHGLEDECSAAESGARHALKIRSQFAHFNWGDDVTAGLFFADLQDAAEPDEGFDYTFNHVDAPLLERQYAFYAHVMDWLTYLDLEMAVRQERMAPHNWPRPPALDPPPPHNPADQHIPPWISEDQKALHVAPALAAKGGPPTPTPAQQAQDRRRQEKQAQKQAQREKDVAAHLAKKERGE